MIHVNDSIANKISKFWIFYPENEEPSSEEDNDTSLIHIVIIIIQSVSFWHVKQPSYHYQKTNKSVLDVSQIYINLVNMKAHGGKNRI